MNKLALVAAIGIAVIAYGVYVLNKSTDNAVASARLAGCKIGVYKLLVEGMGAEPSPDLAAKIQYFCNQAVN